MASYMIKFGENDANLFFTHPHPFQANIIVELVAASYDIHFLYLCDVIPIDVV